MLDCLILGYGNPSQNEWMMEPCQSFLSANNFTEFHYTILNPKHVVSIGVDTPKKLTLPKTKIALRKFWGWKMNFHSSSFLSRCPCRGSVSRELQLQLGDSFFLVFLLDSRFFYHFSTKKKGVKLTALDFSRKKNKAMDSKVASLPRDQIRHFFGGCLGMQNSFVCCLSGLGAVW